MICYFIFLNSSKVWYFLHTLDDEELRIEITPKMRSLLDKMRRLNALSDNAFLPLLLSLLTIQLVGRSANEQPYTTQELEGLLEYLERFGFLIYGVAGRDTAKNEWIELAFNAFRAYRDGEENIVIEKLPTLEKSFFNRQGNSGLELLEESIHSKKNEIFKLNLIYKMITPLLYQKSTKLILKNILFSIKAHILFSIFPLSFLFFESTNNYMI